MAAIVAGISFIQPVFAQEGGSLSVILTDYYGVKDALVAGDSKAASAKAGELVKAVGAVDMKALAAKDHTTFVSVQEKLAFHARHISESTDIGHQREHFADLSKEMSVLAKGARLGSEPIYEEYCPMKKASWLSGEQAIKNPYYGSSMLTCGKVTATVKP
ncbi:MAG: DUF3347 domain-containing protein [Bacteroidetes bacterium]|nr:DUF3347 domain-containing protein [Bacteroidota bacterium]